MLGLAGYLGPISVGLEWRLNPAQRSAFVSAIHAMQSTSGT
jgi:hypothetical protein